MYHKNLVVNLCPMSSPLLKNGGLKSFFWLNLPSKMSCSISFLI